MAMPHALAAPQGMGYPPWLSSSMMSSMPHFAGGGGGSAYPLVMMQSAMGHLGQHPHAHTHPHAHLHAGHPGHAHGVMPGSGMAAQQNPFMQMPAGLSGLGGVGVGAGVGPGMQHHGMPWPQFGGMGPGGAGGLGGLPHSSFQPPGSMMMGGAAMYPGMMLMPFGMPPEDASGRGSGEGAGHT